MDQPVEAAAAAAIEPPDSPVPPQTAAALLGQLLASVDALRNGRAVWTLLVAFAFAGLLMSSAGQSAAQSVGAAAAEGGGLAALLQGLAALACAFWGGNTAGILLMDQARGRPPRDVVEAARAALPVATRLLGVLLLGLAVLAAVGAGVGALLWLARPEVLGVRAGALLFGLTVPVGVLGIGTVLLALGAVVAPLAAPALWAGLSLRQTLELLIVTLRRRALLVALMVMGATLVAAAVAALLTAVVVGGGRLVAAGAVLITGVDVPPQQLMAGLFGHGPRGMGGSGAPVVRSLHGGAALVGGGVVFALALVLPALVYLRGLCGVLLVVRAPPPTADA